MFLNESMYSESVQPLAERYIDGSEASMMRILYECSEEWGTLTEKSLKMQATAALREDANLLSEGIKEVWDKVVEFFKKMWARIKQFFSKFWAYMTGMISMDKKWISKNRKLLDGLNVKEFTVSTYISKIGLGATKLTDYNTLLNYAIDTAADHKDELDAMSDAIEKEEMFEAMFGTSEKEQNEFTQSDFDAAVKAFETIDKEVKEVKDQEKEVNKLFEAIISVAKKVGVEKGAGNGYTQKNTSGTYVKASVGGSQSTSDIKTATNRMKAVKGNAGYERDKDGSKIFLDNAKKAAQVASKIGAMSVTVVKAYRADLKAIILKGLGSRMFKDENSNKSESYEFGVLSQF